MHFAYFSVQITGVICYLPSENYKKSSLAVFYRQGLIALFYYAFAVFGAMRFPPAPKPVYFDVLSITAPNLNTVNSLSIPSTLISTLCSSPSFGTSTQAEV